MSWLDSIGYSMSPVRFSAVFLWPAVWALGAAVFSFGVSGGFLFIVGLQPMALGLALLPFVLASFVLLCIGAGYYWELLRLTQSSTTPHPQALLARWPRYLSEGFQLLLFYTVTTLFLGAAALMFDAVSGWAMLALLLVFHPVLAAPMVFSTHDKTFLGLLDACLDALALTKAPHYTTVWQQASAYLLLAGGVLYPLAILLVGFSTVGLLLVPGLLGAFVLGYGHLLTYLCPQTVQKTVMVNNPFADNPGDKKVQSLYIPAKAPEKRMIYPIRKSPWRP